MLAARLCFCWNSQLIWYRGHLRLHKLLVSFFGQVEFYFLNVLFVQAWKDNLVSICIIWVILRLNLLSEAWFESHTLNKFSVLFIYFHFEIGFGAQRPGPLFDFRFNNHLWERPSFSDHVSSFLSLLFNPDFPEFLLNGNFPLNLLGMFDFPFETVKPFSVIGQSRQHTYQKSLSLWKKWNYAWATSW